MERKIWLVKIRHTMISSSTWTIDEAVVGGGMKVIEQVVDTNVAVGVAKRL